jgi:hypothetical protein
VIAAVDYVENRLRILHGRGYNDLLDALVEERLQLLTGKELSRALEDDVDALNRDLPISNETKRAKDPNAPFNAHIRLTIRAIVYRKADESKRGEKAKKSELKFLTPTGLSATLYLTMWTPPGRVTAMQPSFSTHSYFQVPIASIRQHDKQDG